MRIRSALFFTLLTSAARADVLFLDFNNAPLEIAAAQRGASSHNPIETVIVIPGSGGGRKLTSDMIRDRLEALKRQGTSISSVVISGHDGNGAFDGTQGTMSDRVMQDVFSEYPSVMGKTRSVLLWGCYTTNLGSLDAHWRKVFPQVTVFAGYDGKGWLKDRVESHTYLEDYLRFENAIVGARDERQLRDAVGHIRNFRRDNAICANNLMITPTGSGLLVRSTEQILEACRREDPNKKALAARYLCFYEARKGCENPPTDDDQTDLRKYYRILQGSAHCRADLTEQHRSDDPSADDVRNLIFYDNIKRTLGNVHRQELSAIDAGLAELGAPPNARVSDFDKISRAEAREKMRAIQGFLASRRGNLKADVLRSAVAELDGLVGNMQRTPQGWYEFNQNPSMFLQNSLAGQRVGEIQVQTTVDQLATRMEAERERLMAPSLATRKAQLERNLMDALRANAGGQNRVLVDRAAAELNYLRAQITRETSAVLAQRVEAEMQRGTLSAAERQAYQIYLARLRPR